MRRLHAGALLLAGFVATTGARAADGCAYEKLSVGPYASFALVDDAVVSPDAGFVLVRKGGKETRLVFADGSDSKTSQSPSDQPVIVVNDREVALASKSEWTAIDVRTDARRPLGDARNAGKTFNRFTGSQGRIKLKTLYPTVLLLKIMPEDAQAYGQAHADLLAGFLSEGRIDDFAGWRVRKKPIDALVSSAVYDAAVEAYCFRASEAAQADPVLSKIDPNKVWSFVWTALAELFQANHELIKPDDFGHFTDVSAWRRHDRLNVTLLGTQPIAAGVRNIYGFFQQAMPEIDLRGLKAPQKLEYEWMQGAKTFHAALSLDPRAKLRDVKRTRLPAGARRGLVIFDKTLDPHEVESARGQYRAYFEGQGFRFADPKKLPDVVDWLTRERPPEVDYIIRDGHADGDDDDLIVLYQDGFSQRGEKPGTGEFVEFVYNLEENSSMRRLDYDAFATLLARRGGKKPLVYLDTSCWGAEESWISLSHFKASQLLQLASRTPFNTFRASGARDATHILLDAIRAGEAFDSVRKKLSLTPDYASGRGDTVIFPDEQLYPQARPQVKIRRAMFVREGNGPFAAYFPDGYL